MDRAFVVVGLGYGDEGKGGLVDQLARVHGARTVVRFNGGAQAAHNVVCVDGRQHTFRQLGAASFVDGVQTVLSRFVCVNPMELFVEAEAFGSGVLERVVIDAQAPLTTPFHVAANRLREHARGASRHGSCGLGIGETMRDVAAGLQLRAGDLRADDLRARLAAVQQRKQAEVAELMATDSVAWDLSWDLRSPDALDDAVAVFRTLGALVPVLDAPQLRGTVIFEGAQGVLLDQHAAFFPYATYSTTTPANALELARGFDAVEVIGVIRSYLTRHGAGPLVTEDASFDQPELHNALGPWQGAWRIGHADLVALRYAARAAGRLDSLAVTHLDRVTDDWQAAVAYRAPDGRLIDDLGPHGDRARQLALTDLVSGCSPVYAPARDLLGAYEDATGAPVRYLAAGPTAADRHARQGSSLPSGGSNSTMRVADNARAMRAARSS